MMRFFVLLYSLLSFTVIFSVSTSTFAGVLLLDDCKELQDRANCIAKGNVHSIYIFDKITDDDFHSIAFFATQLPIDKPFPKIILNALGGSMDAAIGIGRILRWRNASAQTQDIFNKNELPMCYSACVLIAAGAVERNLDVIGLHSGLRRKHINRENYERIPLPKESVDRVHNYYREMGISNEIIEIEKATPFHDIRYIYYDPDTPLKQQLIYQLGFRMNSPSLDEVTDIKNRLNNRRISNGSLDELAKRGDAEAQFKLGSNLFYGSNSWSKNTERGIFWLKQSAEQNNTDALHLLGVIYSQGLDNITINETEAFSYYLKAASLGLGSSQNNVAWAYYNGEGVEKNIFEAIYWATKATERGDFFSYGTLGAIRLKTDVFVKDDIETYKWLKLGTDLMPNGSGRDDDLQLLEILKKRMTADQITQGDRRAKNWKPLLQSKNQMRNKDD